MEEHTPAKFVQHAHRVTGDFQELQNKHSSINNNGHGLEGWVVAPVDSYKCARGKLMVYWQVKESGEVLFCSQRGQTKEMTPWIGHHRPYQVSLSSLSHRQLRVIMSNVSMTHGNFQLLKVHIFPLRPSFTGCCVCNRISSMKRILVLEERIGQILWIPVCWILISDPFWTVRSWGLDLCHLPKRIDCFPLPVLLELDWVMPCT